ncbi:MAG: SAM-dependent methyltransferase [Acidobacteriota bacterium]
MFDPHIGIGCPRKWSLAGLVLAIFVIRGQTSLEAQDAQPLLWRLDLEQGETATRVLRFTNFCNSIHRFEATIEGLDILRLRNGGSISVAAGASFDIEVEINATGRESGSLRGRIHVQCLSCQEEAGCSAGRTTLRVQITIVPAKAWSFRHAQLPTPCEVARQEGDNVAELFLSKIDQLACLPRESLSDGIIAPEEKGYPYLAAWSAQWAFTVAGHRLSLENLDGAKGFTESERTLLALTGSRRRAFRREPRLEPAFLTTVLLRTIREIQQVRNARDWLPSAEWLSQALRRAGQIMEPGDNSWRPELLTEEERALLDRVVRQTWQEAIGGRSQLARRPYLPGVERVDLDSQFDARRFQWGPNPDGKHALQSFAAFQEEALYGSYGYYTTNHARIGEEGHFRTTPQKTFPVLGGLIGELAHSVFQRLTAQAPRSEEPFIVREDGGGRGELARSLLLYLQSMALLTTAGSYQRLWDRLRFVEVEISPQRVQEQRNATSSLVEQGLLQPGRFEVRLADATRHVTPGLQGLVFSNELLDVLVVEKFYVSVWGRVDLVCPIPYFAGHADKSRFFSLIWRRNAGRARRESERFADSYQLPHNDSRIYLTVELFREYQQWLRALELRWDRWVEGGERMPEERRQVLAAHSPFFLEGLIDVERIPALRKLLLSRFSNLLAGLVFRGELESEAYLELETARYLSTLDRSLTKGGALIIDYMGTSPVPNNSMLLTYGREREEFRQANPYSEFGRKDITLPPDSALLRREAAKLGWREESFGPQELLRHLTGVGRRPRIAIGLLLAHARFLFLPRVEPDRRPGFDQWLIGLAASAGDGAEFLDLLKNRSTGSFPRAHAPSDLQALERTLHFARSDQPWEPENPNFQLYFGTKSLEDASGAN